MKDLKSNLSKRRAELADRLSRLDRDAQRVSEPLVADFAEQAVQRENDEVVDRLREGTTAELRSISQALTRLELGTYGQCMECGERIDAARLDAMPATSHGLDCESAFPQR
jgi:DnaK suppressor protein